MNPEKWLLIPTNLEQLETVNVKLQTNQSTVFSIFTQPHFSIIRNYYVDFFMLSPHSEVEYNFENVQRERIRILMLLLVECGSYNTFFHTIASFKE